MSKFRKKPVVVEAEQFWPDKPIPFREHGPYVGYDGDFYVITIDGDCINLTPGDWVIKESRGTFHAYPCDPDIFEATYELVDTDTGSAGAQPMPEEVRGAIEMLLGDREWTFEGIELARIEVRDWLNAQPKGEG